MSLLRLMRAITPVDLSILTNKCGRDGATSDIGSAVGTYSKQVGFRNERSRMKIYLIDNQGSGFADQIEVVSGTRIPQGFGDEGEVEKFDIGECIEISQRSFDCPRAASGR